VSPALRSRKPLIARYTIESGALMLRVFNLAAGRAGVSGYNAAKTTDESPERVATVQRLTWAYLRSALYPEDPAWSAASAALASLTELGRLECK
jgi:hypothetical protein